MLIKARLLKALSSALGFCVFAWLSAPTPTAATNYYVSLDGSDGNPGTESAPWRTIGKAFQTAAAGDTGFVNDGVYYEGKIYTGHSGTADRPITFKANGSNVVLDATGFGFGIHIGYSHDYIVVDGFEIRNGAERNVIIGRSKGCIVKNCRIHDCPSDGVFVWESDHCEILNCLFYNCGYSSEYTHAIYFAGSRLNGEPTEHVARGNTFRDGSNISFNGISNNEASDDWFIGCICEDNIIYNMKWEGIFVANTKESMFRNNLIFNCGTNFTSGCVSLGSGADPAVRPDAYGSKDNKIVNNTVVDHNQAAIKLGGGGGNVVFNNIAVSGSVNNAIVSSSGSDSVSDSNIKVAFGDETTLGALFAEWKTIEWTSSDFRPGGTSSARDAGLNSYQGAQAPTYDLIGTTRPRGNGYDVGAYEFVEGQQSYILTISPNQGGSVSKNPNKSSYTQDEQVLLTATPDVGWTFTGWSGDLTGTTNPAPLTMTSNKTVGAGFAEILQSYALTILPSQGGSVSKNPNKSSYTQDEQVLLTATPDVGWVFTGWSGDLTGTTNPATLTMTSDKTVGAGFAPEAPDLEGPSIVVGNPAEGAVNVDPRNTTIFFMASDGRTGVDTNAVTVRINGTAPAHVSYTGDPSAYAIVCEPSGPLPSNSTIVVNVTVADRASPPNTTPREWSFATRDTPPSIPTGLTANGGNDGCATLTWSANPEPDIAGYTLYYGTASVGPGGATEYDDSMTVGTVTTRNICALTNGTYYFAIRARNASGLSSPYSAEVSADVTDLPPQGPIPPQQVQAQETTPGCVTVTWQANPEPDIDGYVVYYGTASVGPGGATEYDDSMNVGKTTAKEICGFPRGVRFFALRAYNTEGLYSGYSTEKPVDVKGPDIDPPTVIVASPANGAIDVSQSAEILFVLSDAQSGIDTNTVAVSIGGLSPSRVTFVGDTRQYAVICRPNGEMPARTRINVVVTASDLAVPANEASANWSFTTGSSRPSAPTGLTAQGHNTGCATLTWDPAPNGDLAGYMVYLGTQSVETGGASGYSDSLSVGMTTSQAICGLLDGTYYFAVRAKSIWGKWSEYSSEASANVSNADTQAPPPPQQVQVAETSPGCVRVSWQPSSDPDLAGYVVYHRPVSQIGAGAAEYSDSVDVGNKTSADVCTLAKGMYYFAVRAYDTSDLYSVFSTEKWISVVGRDLTGPKVLVGGPLNDAIEVRPTSNVFFVVSDGQTGVDRNSVFVSINGEPPTRVVLSGDPSAFAVVCEPGDELPLNTRVTVQVTAADLASPPNLTRVSWSFMTTSGRASAPTGLTAQGDDMGCVRVAWNANPETDVTGYAIYYGKVSVALGDAESYEDSLTVGVITSRTICGLSNGTYYFALRARSEAGLLSAPSVEASAQVTNGNTQGPRPPENISAVETYPGCVKVSWRPNSEPDIAGYVVYHGARSVENGDASEYDESVDVGEKATYQMCDFPKGEYFIAVRAYDEGHAFSGFSAEYQVYVSGEDREAPRILVANPRDGATDVALNASVLFVVSDGQTGVDRNSIDVQINGSSPQTMTVNGDSTGYAIVCETEGGLPENSTVTVEVTASDFAESPNDTTITWSFSTGATTDVEPPTLVAQEPTSGAKNVEPSAMVRLRFSDDSGISTPTLQFFVDGVGVTDTSFTFEANGDVIVAYNNEQGFVPGATVAVRVVASDLASNTSTEEFSFQVQVAVIAPTSSGLLIVPDGYWAHDGSKELEIRNLPHGWTVKIFDTAGLEVKSFTNDWEKMDWPWDFSNNHGRRVAKSLYLIRVLDESGSVKRRGRFIVQSDS